MPSPHVFVPYEKIEGYIEFILQNRLNPEIYFDSESLDVITMDSIVTLKERLCNDLSLSFHAPFMDLSPGAIDSKVRKATIERFNHVFEIAKILRPKNIVFHSGYEKWKYALKVDTWLEKSLETWKPLREQARELGIKIAIENIFEDEPTNLKVLMENMHSDNFGICFDVGHYNLFSKVPLEEWLKALKPYIVELHLHDNDRSADLHHAIGDGNFDFDTLFSIMKGTDCIYTIENHSPEGVLKSAERLEQYIGHVL
ncbi:sugar phosphate isomerase/epimerase [Thermodesulfovibrionales bacterium]|nr:sugar phosphate isomerase/epimerase [Thermodesulfovibrionales bacterium]